MTIQKPPVRDVPESGNFILTPRWEKFFFSGYDESLLSETHRARTDNPHSTSDANLLFSDITTNNVSTLKHGFVPKAPNDGTKFLDGLGAWDTVKDSDLALTDVTTNNVSITKHGFVPKAPNLTTQYLRGDATWASLTSASWDHGGLGGLADDDHTQYPLLVGRSTGQHLKGGTAAGEDLTLTSTNHGTKGSIYIGGDGSANCTEVEADGTLKFNGSATVWDDLPPVPIVAARLGSTAPTLATFIGNIEQYTFDATNDYVIGATEVVHTYKEGTNIVPHIHWATNSADVGDTGVKWQLEFSVSNVDGAAPFIYAFTAPTVTTSVDTLIPGGTAAKSHIISNFADNVPGTGLKIGAYIVWRLNRIASATAAPASDPFALAIGFHYEIDTVGSRTISDK